MSKPMNIEEVGIRAGLIVTHCLYPKKEALPLDSSKLQTPVAQYLGRNPTDEEFRTYAKAYWRARKGKCNDRMDLVEDLKGTNE